MKRSVLAKRIVWIAVHPTLTRLRGRDDGMAAAAESRVANSRWNTPLWHANLLTTMGRFEEALAESRRAQELDPLSLIASLSESWVYYYERRYDDAIAQIQKSLEMDPTFVVSHWYLGLCYQLKGMEQEALTEVEEAVRLSGGDPLYLAAFGRVQASFGRTAEAKATLARLDEMASARYVSSYYVAAIPAALGDRDQAFARLESAVEVRSHGLTFLLVDPGVDPLRSDPRFDDLLRRVGLPTKRSI